MGKKTYTVLGDSISVEYTKRLSEILARDYYFAPKTEGREAYEDLDIPKGANCGDSRMLLEYLSASKCAGTLKSDLYLINAGLHDIKTDPATGVRQISDTEYEKNIHAILSVFKQENISVIFINTTNAEESIHNDRIQKFFRYHNDVLTINEIAERVCAKLDVPMIDLYGFTFGFGTDAFKDHVHFGQEISDKQAAYIAEEVISIMSRADVINQLPLAEIEGILSNMTLKEKVGQLCVPILQSGYITDDIKRQITEYHIGMIRYCPNAEYDSLSVMVGEPNKHFTPGEMSAFTNSLQELALSTKSGIPLIIAADQEGSTRCDINRSNALVYAGHMCFGAADDLELTYSVAKATADEFAAMGINLVQAPIIDVLTYQGRMTMKAACFGESPKKVAQHAKAMRKGFADGNILSMAKHFPGYGSVATDAHKGTSVIEKSLEDLEREDIAPLKELFAEGLDGVMTGHVFTKCIDDKLPATLSKKMITGYLRNTLNYNGLVETDAMRMHAIQDHYGTGEASVMAVDAGCDLVLLRGDFQHFEEGYEAVLTAAESGSIPMERIDEAVLRILKAKNKIGLFIKPFTNPEIADNIIGCEKHRQLSKLLADKSGSVQKSKDIPIRGNEKILDVSVEPQKIAGANDPIQSVDMLIKAIASRHADTTGLMLPLTPSAEEIQETVLKANGADVIVVGVCNAIIYKSQADLVKQLAETGKKLIVVAMDSPYDIEEMPYVENYICTLGVANDWMVSAAACIFGDLSGRVALPVTVNI